jgi:hypothetical protein
VALVALPIYIVIQSYQRAALAGAVVAVASVILKITWYDHLRKLEVEMAANAELSSGRA